MMLQAMDTMLQANNTAQSSQSSKQQQDGQDFGSMVRQRQQENKAPSRSTESGNARSSQDARGSSDAPSDDTQDPTVEQIVIAAALVLPPNLDFITFSTTPEENNITVELGQEFLPDMHIDEVEAVPVIKAADDTGREIFHLVREDGPHMETQVRETEEDFSGLMDTGAEEEGGEETVVLEDAAETSPLFGFMNATPVKVSSAGESPVELEAQDGMEQFAGRIEEVLTDGDGSSHVQITLEPASLGRVTVNITHTADGALHIQLSATTLRAAELLEHNTGTLQHLLAENRSQVRIEVRETPRESQVLFVDPNGDNPQNQQQRQQNQSRQDQRQSRHQTRDFLQQLRLGLVELSSAG